MTLPEGTRPKYYHLEIPMHQHRFFYKNTIINHQNIGTLSTQKEV